MLADESHLDDSDLKVVSGSDLSARQLHDLLSLRVQIFVVEQECPYQEIDGRDLEEQTEHVWIEDNAGIAAAIRVLADPEHGATARRIGRVVTRPDRRGEQLAQRLMDITLARLGAIDTRLEAQSHLVGYYSRLGYVPSGPEYLEDGIPHTPMARLAPSSDSHAQTSSGADQ